MTTARLLILVTILVRVWPTTLCLSANAGRRYELVPQFDGKDLTRGDKRVWVTAPKGWERRKYRGPVWPGFAPREIEYSVAFLRKCGSANGLVIQVETNHIGHHNSAKITPRNSFTGINMNTDIKGLELIETFDGGSNGKLDVWRFRTYNRAYILVLIIQPDGNGRIEVDASLSAYDVKQVMPYLSTLKTLARSIRIE